MHRREIQVGRKTLSIETGKLAKQADGAVVVRYGDTIVLVTACYAANAREGIDFLPLTVDYREYTYASGRIPGGFFKREGKPSEKEVLTSRLIDRPYAPALSDRLAQRDAGHRAGALGRLGERLRRARAHRRLGRGLAISEIPVQKTTAGVRVGLIGSEFIINPTYEERKRSRLDLILAGTREAIVMVEAGAKEVTEDEIVRALEDGTRRHPARLSRPSRISRARWASPKLTVSRKDIGHEFYREVEEKRAGSAQRGDAHSRQDRELRSRRSAARRPDRVAARG